MKIGVIFPQTEIGRDPAVIRDYAQAVEAMGYTHILAFDSVVDGWITLPRFRPGPAAQRTVDRLHGLVREAGRDPAAFGIEGRLALAQVPAEARAKEIRGLARDARHREHSNASSETFWASLTALQEE